MSVLSKVAVRYLDKNRAKEHRSQSSSTGACLLYPDSHPSTHPIHSRNEIDRILLCKLSPVRDSIEQLSTDGQLKHEVPLVPALEIVKEFDNVGVVETFENVDLVKDVGFVTFDEGFRDYSGG